MPKRIKLENHLPNRELYQRYRKCQQAREKVRWQALYLISQGDTANAVAKRLGRCSGWISKITRRYNQLGAAGVADQRGPIACGRKPTLSPQQKHELDAALHQAPADGGLWSAPKVAAWIAEKTGKAVHPTTALRLLHALGFSLQTPRRQHRQRANLEQQAAFKKS